MLFVAEPTEQTETQGEDRPRVATTPGNSLLDNLRYLAFKTIADADKLAECEHLVRLVYETLGIPLAAGRAERVAVLQRVLHDVMSYERGRAISAGDPAIAAGAVMTHLGPNKHSFEVAAAGELLGLTNDEQLSKVRRTLGVTDGHWQLLISKEGRGKRIRQPRARLWLGERQAGDYASRGARDREDELLDVFGLALETDLRDSPVRASLLTFAASNVNRGSAAPEKQVSIGDGDGQTDVSQPELQASPIVGGSEPGQAASAPPVPQSPVVIWKKIVQSFKADSDVTNVKRAELFSQLSNSYKASNKPITEAQFTKAIALIVVFSLILGMLVWFLLANGGWSAR